MGCSHNQGVKGPGQKVIEDNTRFVGEHFDLAGVKDPYSDEMEAKVYAGMGDIGWNPMEPNTCVNGLRGIMALMPKFYGEGTDQWPLLQKWVSQVDIEEHLDCGGPAFHPNAAVVKAYTIREKGKMGQPCLIEYHGGGAVAGSAEACNMDMARYAVQCGVTVVNVDYRLAPEHKIPCGIDDGYAAVKWVIANAEKLGIDGSRIALMGESGGGLITGGVSMRLAEANEGHLVRFQAQVIPMTTNAFITKPDSYFDEWELGEGMCRMVNTDIIRQLAVDFDKRDPLEVAKDVNIFPNEISDILCKRAPPLLVVTCEFDDCKKSGIEVAAKFRKNQNLLGLAILKGAHHGHYMDYNHPRTDPWFKVFEDACKKYLHP